MGAFNSGLGQWGELLGWGTSPNLGNDPVPTDRFMQYVNAYAPQYGWNAVTGQWELANVKTQTPEEEQKRLVARARAREAEYRKIRLARLAEIRVEFEERQRVGEGMVTNKFLIGCDPEFLVLDAGRHINVRDFLGAEGGEVGSDHGGRVAELRPKPSRSAFLLLHRLRDLLKHPLVVKIPNRDTFRGGAFFQNESIGGHIHINVDPFLDKVGKKMPINPSTGRLQESPEHKTIIKALDVVTRRLEDLDILPKQECASRRGAAQYGRFGDVRFMDRRFEYRTMASWLYSPKTAYICLTAAKLAAAAPESVFEVMKEGANMPWERFKDWLDVFNKDADALRVRNKLAAHGLRACQQDPEQNFRDKWETLV